MEGWRHGKGKRDYGCVPNAGKLKSTASLNGRFVKMDTCKRQASGHSSGF